MYEHPEILGIDLNRTIEELAPSTYLDKVIEELAPPCIIYAKRLNDIRESKYRLIRKAAERKKAEKRLARKISEREKRKWERFCAIWPAIALTIGLKEKQRWEHFCAIWYQIGIRAEDKHHDYMASMSLALCWVTIAHKLTREYKSEIKEFANTFYDKIDKDWKQRSVISLVLLRRIRKFHKELLNIYRLRYTFPAAEEDKKRFLKMIELNLNYRSYSCKPSSLQLTVNSKG